MINREDFKNKLIEQGGMDWLTAYWFANVMEYIDELKGRIKQLEQSTNNPIATDKD
jgi:hypothetical protein